MSRSRESRVAELEAHGDRRRNTAVIAYRPGADVDALVARAHCDGVHGTLIVPEEARDDGEFDRLRASGAYGPPPAPVAASEAQVETVGNAESATPVAPVDDWQAALDELARRLAARDRYEGGKAD